MVAWCAVILITVIALPGSLAQAARSCWDDTLKSVTQDGSILVMQSGAVYEVLAGDEIDSMLWLPLTDILVCRIDTLHRGKPLTYFDIINTDDSEKVGALRLR